MSVSKEPLSVRNNNPGNLRYVGQEGATPGEGGFARFETPEAGMEAMRRQIELDTQKRGMNLTQFINKYAPPSENKTQGYIDFVVQKTGLDPTKPVPAEMIPAIQTAMIQMEGGPGAAQKFASTSAPAPAPTTPTATRPAQYVQVAQGPRTTTPASPKLTDLPPSYRAALAANYIADTEDPEVSIADKAMAMLEEMQGGGGPRGAATFNKMMGQEEAPNPFALMAKAQEPEVQPRRRPVPRMPQRFSNGGAVSNEVPRVDAQGKVIRDAPIPERPLSVGEQAVGMGEAALSLASGLTAPASIAYDVMRGVPRQEISPSRFMYTPRTEGGQRAAEGLGRFMQEYKLDVATPQVQLQRPYPVKAAAKQGIEALRTTGEALELPFMTDTPPLGIIKPKGGTFLSGPTSTFDTALNSFTERLQSIERGYKNNNLPELANKAKAVEEFVNTKFKNYYKKRLGSQDDPLREAFIRGDFDGSDYYYEPEQINVYREILQDPDIEPGSMQHTKALNKLNEMYDTWTDIVPVVPESLVKKVEASLGKSPDRFKRFIYAEDIADEIRKKKFEEQGVNVHPKEISPSVLQTTDDVLDEGSKRAIKEGDIPYDVEGGATLAYRLQELSDYLMTLAPNQIKNLTFEDAMIRAERYHNELKNPVKTFTPTELFEGREVIFQPSKKYKWTEIKTEEALRREGDAMNHCIKGDAYCQQLTSGIGRHFSLQDAETGVPHVTISTYRSPYAKRDDANHVIVEQIKGNSNSVAEKYFPEIEKFLEDYEKRVGKIYITEGKKHIPPGFKSDEYTKMPRGYEGNQYGPENFAKGGIVDKPLYDRAA